MQRTAKVLLLGLLASPSAFAAPSPPPDHAAVESFRRGTRLVEAGKLQDAVDAFRDALQREPASVGARLDLADCYEKIGAPASAWREYVIAEAYARKAGDAREALARSSAGGLETRLFVVRLVGEAPSAMELHVDGDPVAPEILARASVALAPGHHRVELSAPGKSAVSVELAGNAGETSPLPIGFENEPSRLAPSAEETHPAPQPAPAQKTWGFALGGVGIVGAGLGGAFGGLALSKRSTLEQESHDPSIGSARFYSDRSSADTLAAASTAAFVAGALALAAGVTLVALAPAGRAHAAVGWVRVGGTGIVVGGDF